MDKQAIQQQALNNAVNGQSLMNYAAIISGFAEKGIPQADIQSRVNVFTYNAWRALGRQVRKGEHGVKVCTYVKMEKKDDGSNDDDRAEGRSFRAPRMTTVFHITQTDPIPGSTQRDMFAAPADANTGPGTQAGTHASAYEIKPQSPAEQDSYTARVNAYESRGMTTSDAQAAVDAEDMKAARAQPDPQPAAQGYYSEEFTPL